MIICNEPANLRDRRRRMGRVVLLAAPSLRGPYLADPWLTFRQEILFDDLADIYRAERGMSAAGKADTSPTYRRVATGVPCHLNRNPSRSLLERMGRVEQDDMFTLDIWEFAEDQEIADTWVIVCKSVRPGTSTGNQNYGKAWACQGDKQPITASTEREAGRSIIIAVSMPALPSGISL